jgi:hypothetical protein
VSWFLSCHLLVWSGLVWSGLVWSGFTQVLLTNAILNAAMALGSRESKFRRFPVQLASNGTPPTRKTDVRACTREFTFS